MGPCDIAKGMHDIPGLENCRCTPMISVDLRILKLRGLKEGRLHHVNRLWIILKAQPIHDTHIYHLHLYSTLCTLECYTGMFFLTFIRTHRKNHTKRTLGVFWDPRPLPYTHLIIGKQSGQFQMYRSKRS